MEKPGFARRMFSPGLTSTSIAISSAPEQPQARITSCNISGHYTGSQFKVLIFNKLLWKCNLPVQDKQHCGNTPGSSENWLAAGSCKFQLPKTALSSYLALDLTVVLQQWNMKIVLKCCTTLQKMSISLSLHEFYSIPNWVFKLFSCSL